MTYTQQNLPTNPHNNELEGCDLVGQIFGRCRDKWSDLQGTFIVEAVVEYLSSLEKELRFENQ